MKSDNKKILIVEDDPAMKAGQESDKSHLTLFL